jgi:hypothetical protein
LRRSIYLLIDVIDALVFINLLNCFIYSLSVLKPLLQLSLCSLKNKIYWFSLLCVSVESLISL